MVQTVISSVVKGISGRVVRRTGRGSMILVSLYPLKKIEITNHFSYKPRFNGVFSTNNLPRVKDGSYVINLNDRNSKETHWISLFIIKMQLYTLILFN